MATVTGYTAERMYEIEQSCIVSGAVDLSGHLILSARDGRTVDAGSVHDGPRMTSIENSITNLSGLVSTNATDINTLEGITGNHNTRITANASSISGLTSNKLDRVNGTASGLKSDTVRLSSTGNVSVSSTTHAFQIGPDNSVNLTMDPNEILVRSNGTKAPLYLHEPRTMETLSFSGGDARQLVSKQYVDNLANPQTNIRYFSGSLTDIANLNTYTSGYYWIDPANVTAGKPVTFNYGFLKIELIGGSRFATIHSVPGGLTLTTAWNTATGTTYWQNTPTVIKELTSGDNLNDMTAEGTYFNNANAYATGANNYPCPWAGKLEVKRPSDRGDFIYQEYEAYGQRNGHNYVRGWYSNTWSAWRRVGGHLGGTIAIDGGVNTPRNAVVSFPTGHFNIAPVVTVTAVSSIPASNSVSYAASTTSVTLYVQRNVSGAVGVGWIALEKQQ